MRPIFLVVVMVSLILCLAEGSKNERKRNKKQHQSKSGGGDEIMENFVDGDKDNSEEDVDHNKSHRFKEGNKMKKHHKKGKESRKFDHMQHLTWLNIKKDSDCGLECKSGEVCIIGPIDTKPLCVLGKDLKKSMKMFHRYQKKEMKAWKQFQKEYHRDNSMTEHLDKAEMKKQQLQAQNVDHQKGAVKEKTELIKTSILAEAGEPEVCSTSQFSQMRTRLMGWFHLLHGQDHFARKAHDGNIKHFYKHVSVKKELREHQDGQQVIAKTGDILKRQFLLIKNVRDFYFTNSSTTQSTTERNKCECLKSAMWQFLQMDKNGDDNLSNSEISILKENSLEPCMQPYLTSCDHNADGKFSSNEWCCCFSNVVAPCFHKVDEIRRSGEPVTYMPRCDKEGYFMREQCSGDSEKSYKCWCADYNGNEFKGTLTNGRAHCNKISMYGKE